MGRKSITINLKATSPEGEGKTFKSNPEAARELGFSEFGVRKAYHAERDRIGEYEFGVRKAYHAERERIGNIS